MASGDPETMLAELQREAGACDACPLHEGRTNSVFGAGSPRARLMFVGEAPGYHEDRLGEPFVGQAGKLLDKLLARIGLTRADVYIANVLKCRPPNNRDPQTDEIERCRGFLERQIALVSPLVICTLGNFATKLLSGKPDGISRVHGQPQPLPGGDIRLFPVYHPAAALYTPANLKVLEEDFDRLAAILAENTHVDVETSSSGSPARPVKAQVTVESSGGDKPGGGDAAGAPGTLPAISAPAGGNGTPSPDIYKPSVDPAGAPGDGAPEGEQLGLF